jgi:integrase
LKLTKDNVHTLKLPVGKADAIFFDDEVPGFGLRLRAGSARSEARWIVQYKLGDKQRRLTFGKLSELDPAKARKRAGELMSKVRLGGDPAGEKIEARAHADETFGVIVARFLERQEGRLRASSYSATKRYLESHCKPLHGLALGQVSRSTIAARLTAIAGSNGPVSADRARAALSAFFAWAMREGLCEANPTIATNTHSEAKARERVLTDGELTEIWAVLPTNDYGRILKLLILTGQRREEMAALRWSEIDAYKRLISLPGERTKNHRQHDVPLSDSALEVIGNCLRRGGRELVFGEGEGPFAGWSKSKAALDNAITAARAKWFGKKALALLPWRLHDVRRTVATRMADLGVQPHIIEAVLNHVSGHKAGVAGIYNRATYEREVRAALVLWADHVRTVVEGGAHKMVPLRSAP